MITIRIFVLGVAVAALVCGCTKAENEIKTIDNSAAGRAAAVMSTSSSPKPTVKVDGDLAKIRQIKEREQLEHQTSKESSDAKSSAMAKGAAKPLRDLKY
jgi:hypothetical protein